MHAQHVRAGGHYKRVTETKFLARSPVDFKFSVSCPIKSLSRSCVRPDCYGRSAGFFHGAAEAFPCELSFEKKREKEEGVHLLVQYNI